MGDGSFGTTFCLLPETRQSLICAKKWILLRISGLGMRSRWAAGRMTRVCNNGTSVWEKSC
jgi:hypothetical protein